jgi:hypothetical protein
MGKPMTDLPDSIDPAPTASAEKVDDLLAQMAGEEIDRLLSEADDSRPPGPAQSAPVASVQAVDQQLDALFSGSDETPATPPPPPPAATVHQSTPPRPGAKAVVPNDDEVSKQLTDLFADDPVPTPAAPASVQSAPVAEAVSTPVEIQTPPPAAAIVEHDAIGPDESILPEASTTPEERAALAPQPEDDDQLKLHIDQEDQAEGSAADLKPLEWMNSPMDACPDRLRDLIGKIALLTLFNATAVLIYVFLFRRHH